VAVGAQPVCSPYMNTAPDAKVCVERVAS